LREKKFPVKRKRRLGNWPIAVSIGRGRKILGVRNPGRGGDDLQKVLLPGGHDFAGAGPSRGKPAQEELFQRERRFARANGERGRGVSGKKRGRPRPKINAKPEGLTKKKESLLI